MSEERFDLVIRGRRILTTAGNMAYPFSPFGIPVGPAYRFAVYHLLALRDPCEIFPVTLEEVRN